MAAVADIIYETDRRRGRPRDRMLINFRVAFRERLKMMEGEMMAIGWTQNHIYEKLKIIRFDGGLGSNEEFTVGNIYDE